MKNIDKLNFLYDKYKDKMVGSFHNTLWQILINDCRKDIQSAFVYVFVPSKIGSTHVGIADLNVKGYTPATFDFNTSVSEEERHLILEELNREVFGITKERADQIYFSSMR